MGQKMVPGNKIENREEFLGLRSVNRLAPMLLTTRRWSWILFTHDS